MAFDVDYSAGLPTSLDLRPAHTALPSRLAAARSAYFDLAVILGPVGLFQMLGPTPVSLVVGAILLLSCVIALWAGFKGAGSSLEFVGYGCLVFVLFYFAYYFVLALILNWDQASRMAICSQLPTTCLQGTTRPPASIWGENLFLSACCFATCAFFVFLAYSAWSLVLALAAVAEEEHLDVAEQTARRQSAGPSPASLYRVPGYSYLASELVTPFVSGASRGPLGVASTVWTDL